MFVMGADWTPAVFPLRLYYFTSLLYQVLAGAVSPTSLDAWYHPVHHMSLTVRLQDIHMYHMYQPKPRRRGCKTCITVHDMELTVTNLSSGDGARSEQVT